MKKNNKGLVSMNDIKAKEVCYLWEPYIPSEMITILEGDPGSGKSFLSLYISSIISAGGNFWNGTKTCLKKNKVLYFSAEDSLEYTLKPRLDKMEAEPKNILTLDTTFNLDNDHSLKTLESYISEADPALIIFDPIQGYLDKSVDMNKANHIRSVVNSLKKIAEDYKLAILILRHLAKGEKNKVLYKGLGSIDFAAAARSILFLGENPNNKNERILFHIKSSISKQGEPFSFSINDNRIRFNGYSSLSPEELLQSAFLDRENKSAIFMAEELLKELLSEKPLSAKDIYREANEYNISKSTLNRAKYNLDIKSKKIEGGKFFWFWQGTQGKAV